MINYGGSADATFWDRLDKALSELFKHDKDEDEDPQIIMADEVKEDYTNTTYV